MRLVSRSCLPLVYALERADTGDVVFLDGATVVEAVHALLCRIDDSDLTPDELDALLDPEIFPVSCKTCRYGYINGEILFHLATCNTCLTGLPNWEPKDE